MHYQSNPTASIDVENAALHHAALHQKGEHTKLTPVTAAAPTVVFLDIPATLAHVHVLSRCACALVENVANLEDPAISLYNLELAIQEVAVNIVKHAYAQTEGRIHMTLCLEEQSPQLIILLHDTGQPFDPTQAPQPKLGELQEHGFGLFLARQLMDEVEYSRSAVGNIWKLIKTIRVEA